MEHRRNGVRGVRQALAALRRLVRWGVRRRRVAAGYLLRGVCSGIGTTAVGLTVVWLRSRR